MFTLNTTNCIKIFYQYSVTRGVCVVFFFSFSVIRVNEKWPSTKTLYFGSFNFKIAPGEWKLSGLQGICACFRFFFWSSNLQNNANYLNLCFFLYQEITSIQRKKNYTDPAGKKRNPTPNVHSLLQKLELYRFHFTEFSN